MTTQKANPEKLMLLLFPLITLGLFLTGVLVFHYLPQILNALQSSL